METFGSVAVEEHVHGDTLWVAVRARGAEWSWLTPEDALRLAQYWLATYSVPANRGTARTAGVSCGVTSWLPAAASGPQALVETAGR